LSRTVPLMVASDLLEPAASASLVMKDTSATRDKLKPNALLMRQRPPRPKSLLEAMDSRTGSGEETRTGTPETGRYCPPRRKLLSSYRLHLSAFSAYLCGSLR